MIGGVAQSAFIHTLVSSTTCIFNMFSTVYHLEIHNTISSIEKHFSYYLNVRKVNELQVFLIARCPEELIPVIQHGELVYYVNLVCPKKHRLKNVVLECYID